MNRFLYICLLFTGLILSSYQSIVSAQSSDWVYSPYAQYLTNDTTISPPVGEPADAALSCFRHDTIYVLVMPSGELYIWLKPDPLMDKYIQSSPYAYCDGNPLKYVDPEGCDEFEIQWNPDKESFQVNRIENMDFDQVHVVNAEGQRITSSNQYAYRTLNKSRFESSKNGKMFLLDISGDDNADNLFEFLGSYFTSSNGAPLEWSRVKIGYENSGRNIIGTSMKKQSTGVGQYILNRGYTIRGVDHNHPWGTNPSMTDITNASKYTSRFPNALLRVFTGSDYIIYTSGGIVLPEIEVKSNNF